MQISKFEIEGVIEISKAFASVAVYCRERLELDWSKINPRGKANAGIDVVGVQS